MFSNDNKQQRAQRAQESVNRMSVPEVRLPPNRVAKSLRIDRIRKQGVCRWSGKRRLTLPEGVQELDKALNGEGGKNAL